VSLKHQNSLPLEPAGAQR